ncbi:MAG TPA: hypothetical protein PLZ53_03225 [Candidatus Hydrogenedentes bacterium]|nr:hypothetical protein [Candidatus Hydrogenedentota bacterium]
MTEVPGKDEAAIGVQGKNWLHEMPVVLALLLVLLPLFGGGTGIVVGETVNSRLATVYALIHDGVWHIDRPLSEDPNPFENKTVDKVQRHDGHYLSSKPPVLPLLMAGEYGALHRLFGWELTNTDQLRHVLRIMIFTLMKLPHIIGVLCFALLLRLFLPNRFHVAFLILALGLASPLTGFACQLNNHTPAAAGVMVCLYLGIGLYTARLLPTAWRFLLFGFACAFVFVMDMPVTIFPAVLGLLLLQRFPKQSVLWAGAGALPLLLLHFALMVVITGNPLPVQTQTSMYTFRNSYWRNPIGVDGLNEFWFVYLFHMTFGRFGVFLLFPITLLAFPGVYKKIREPQNLLSLPYFALLTAFLVLSVYYVLFTNNYGGAAYGFRWYNGAIPVLLLLSLPAVSGVRNWKCAFLLVPLFVVSAYSAWECFQAPWGASHEWTCRLLFGPVF